MRNCIVAQSGGPTAVINASVAGIIQGNKLTNYYDNIYGGLNGIEGILKKEIINLSDLADIDIALLKHTPSAALGSCRYKLKDFNVQDNEYIELFKILHAYRIQAFFYIGGNDSMDTVCKLSEYARLKKIDIQFIGIPKTIDNDLQVTDHTPGFGSAAKLVATVALESYLDASVYTDNGIFILETMGRDTGWIAASTALAKINNQPVADFIYLPEAPFSQDQFIDDINRVFCKKKKGFIVVSEGIKDESGKFLCEMKKEGKHDKFDHVQLGGVGVYLKKLVIDSGITTRVRTLELGVIQRSAMHCVSKIDLEEACNVGKVAVEYAIEGKTGCMISMRRINHDPYAVEVFGADVSKVANRIKYFPDEWITPEKNHVTDEAIRYIAPLIQGTPNLVTENGLPKYQVINKVLGATM